MPRGIDDGLAADLQQLVFEGRGIGTSYAVLCESQFDVAATGLALARFAQRRGEVVGVEPGRSEVGDGLPRLADVLLHSATHADELASLALGRGELGIVRQRVELQCDADEALEQRVVQLAAQPRALANQQRELQPHAPHVQAP